MPNIPIGQVIHIPSTIPLQLIKPGNHVMSIASVDFNLEMM
jgi:hypothetical protein